MILFVSKVIVLLTGGLTLNITWSFLLSFPSKIIVYINQMKMYTQILNEIDDEII